MKRTTLLCLLTSLFLVCSCSNKNSCNPSSSQQDTSDTSPSSSEVPQDEVVTIEKNVSLLPNHQVDIDIENDDDGKLDISIQNENLLDVVVKNKNKVSIVGLAEGNTTVKVLTKQNLYVISVECIDLSIANEESYVEKGNTLQINMSKNVQVTYAIDDESVATISDSGLISALSEGTFELTVKYKDIILTKSFDTYIRKNTLEVFNRKNPLIHYLGRNYHANKAVRMDNEGSGFEVFFEGTMLKATLSGKNSSWYGYTMISVLVDDEIDTTKRIVTLNKSSKATEYTLVENLTPGFHRVKVLKRTENLSTYMTLYKLVTDGKFHPVNKENVLKMEVYGDSITAGYGNLRGNLDDQTSATLQSGLQTYASYTAFALGAEINIQARSGIGVYTANNTIGEGNHVKDHFNKVNYDGEHYWNFDNYTPDIVLFNLGTNDYWDPRYNQQTLLTHYVNTIKSIADEYGEDTTFILLSGLMEQEVDAIVQLAKASIQQAIPNAVYTYQFSKCASGHPLYSEHAKASDELIRLIKTNHLDIPHEREQEEPVIPESQGETVNSVTNIKLLDQIKEDSVIYANIGNAKQQLTKIDPFTYQLVLTNQVEGDLDVTFTIDDNEEFTSDHYTIHVRKNFVDNITLDTFLASPSDEEEGENGWTVTNHLFDETVTIIDEHNLTVMNENWLAGLVVRDSEQGDDLKLSVNIKFDHTISDYTQAFAGLCPYYLDDSNFVVVYLQWDSSGNIRGLGCTGIIEGNDIGWNDFFSITGFDTNPTAGIDLSITRNGTSLTAECGGKTEKQNIAGMTGDTEKVGVWNICNDNPVTYSNFNEVHQERVVDETWHYTAHLFDGSMTVNSPNNVTLTNAGNWMAGFAVKECIYADNYYISATLTCASDNFTASEDVSLGLVPYYVNDNNFVVVYLQWTDSRVIKSIGCTGKINGTDLGWNDCWTFQNVQSTLSTGQTLKVTRENTKLTLVYANVTGTITLSALSGAANGFCGLYSNKTTTTFSNIVIASK